MSLLDHDIAGLTGAIWESMFDIGVFEVPVPPGPLAGNTVTASVDITGEWTGTLAMTFPVGMCRQLASRMFRVADADLDDELVRDAVGELANIAGGNVKGMIDAETVLSLPAVRHGGDHRADGLAGHLLAESAFDYGGETFVVSLHGPVEP
jgi:hypothetical protein